MVDVGSEAPHFELPANAGKTISSKDYAGKTVVLYFYPKDNTKGCTTEAQEFRDQIEAFAAAGAVILGVSRDSVKSHDNFIAKQELPFDLISDKEETLCKAFDVIKEKNMYGKIVLGIQRSTFVMDGDWQLIQEWRNVRVKGHVDKVLAYVQSLSA